MPTDKALIAIIMWNMVAVDMMLMRVAKDDVTVVMVADTERGPGHAPKGSQTDNQHVDQRVQSTPLPIMSKSYYAHYSAP